MAFGLYTKSGAVASAWSALDSVATWGHPLYVTFVWSRWRRRPAGRCCWPRRPTRAHWPPGTTRPSGCTGRRSERLADWPDYRARMLLRYGEWLRRQRRAAESRAPLREARDSFDALGFASLAERARARAAGGRGIEQPPGAAAGDS